MTMQAVAVGVMARLKAETAEHHARAEGKALQQKLVRGLLTREEYAAWLGQMLLVHRALEAAVERSRPRAEVLKVITDEQTHSRRLMEDLAFYGVDAHGVRANRATARLIARIDAIAAENPVAVLGLHYVLEGSMNGNTYIAMGVRKGLGLSPGQGDRYLDPYGPQQRAKWAEFRSGVDSCAWTVTDANAAVEGAKAMFEGVGEVCEELGG